MKKYKNFIEEIPAELYYKQPFIKPKFDPIYLVLIGIVLLLIAFVCIFIGNMKANELAGYDYLESYLK